MTTDLAYTQLGTDDPSHRVIMAHGILGSRRNWRSFTQRLLKQRPDLQVIIVDLRGHGDSHGLPGDATVANCATDLVRLGAKLGIERPILMGHSFGGKVCAEAARQWPEAVRQLWVLDAPLGPRQARESTVEAVIAALQQVEMPVAGRSDVADALAERGFSPALCAWMTTNVRRGEGGYVWRFDLPMVQVLLADYFVQDLWPVFSVRRGDAQHFMVRGQRSDTWTQPDLQRLSALQRAGRARDIEVEDAGHWLHADNPAGLLHTLLAGLPPLA
ncbi:MAG: alpha/beta hydrolase [Myxococcales bacterium]|nr:alpha/beta hydrolase [Myxococcales bacterium]